MLLELNNISYNIGSRVIIDNANASFPEGRKYGLIGRNGAGKSTLCRMIIDEEHPDEGRITKHSSLRLGYLRQDEPFIEGETALEFLMRSSSQPEWKCGEVAGTFDIKNDKLSAYPSELSGGWQTRLKLTAMLLEEPNFLLLDEPTNFLDLRTQILLQKFLENWNGACLIVSHDRTFLNAVCEHTLELSYGRLEEYAGRVEEWLVERIERREHAKRVNAGVEAKRKQLQTFINKNKAGANTASQARNKEKQLERLETLDIGTDEAIANIRLPEVSPGKATVFECEDLAIGYPDLLVAKQIHFSIEPGARVILVGDNGEGKTTLLKTITGALEPKGGKLRWGYNKSPTVYAQHVYHSLPPEITARDYLNSIAGNRTEREILNIAGGFLFSGDDVNKRISVLSGGERARLCLAGLFLSASDVLVLDEPVNHLDVETARALANALQEYKGTVIFVSHERDFGQLVSTEVLEIAGGMIKRFPGDYRTYLQLLEDEAGIGDANYVKSKTSTKESDSLKKKKELSNGALKHKLGKDSASLERKIEKLENDVLSLREKQFELTDWQKSAEIQEDIDKLEREMNQLEEEYLEILEKIENL